VWDFESLTLQSLYVSGQIYMSLLPAICIIVLYISTCVIYMNCLSYVPIILAMFMSDFSDFISA